MANDISAQSRAISSEGQASPSARYNDSIDEMSYGRKFARRFKSNRFYNPSYRQQDDSSTEITRSDGDENPILDKAWEYYEHFILPRRFVFNNEEQSRYLKRTKGRSIRAEAGEYLKRTRLYPIWGTTLRDLSDFGIGTTLYFSTVRFLCVICFVAGLINIPNMIYFESDQYTGVHVKREKGEKTWIEKSLELKTIGLRGSAVCTNTKWEICIDCQLGDTLNFEYHRYAWGTLDEDPMVLFVQKNACSLNERFGTLTYCTVLFLILAIYSWTLLQKKRIQLHDECEYSTRNYSIEVKNPPQHNLALSAGFWKRWFEGKFNVKVVACTVTLRNRHLIQALIRRRELISQLQEMIPHISDFNERDLKLNIQKCDDVPLWKQLLLFSPTADVICSRIQKQDDIIRKVSKRKMNVSRVFLTFDLQEHQREVLSKLYVPTFFRIFRFMPDEYRMHGRTLNVDKPAEPTEIRWIDCDAPFVLRLLQGTITTIIIISVVTGLGYLIYLAYDDSMNIKYPTIVITAINGVSPVIVDSVTSFEAHRDDSSLSSSRYIKLTLLRWLPTIVVALVSPFTDSIAKGPFLIDWVYTILLFDLILEPIVLLIDFGGLFNKHIKAPRQPDQRRMNLCFRVKEFDVSERYTNISRVLLFTLFYSILFPLGFFFATAIFFILYWIDKMTILRRNSSATRVGSRMTKTSNMFLLVSIIAYTLGATFMFIQFPFDNLCTLDDTQILPNYYGTWNLRVRGKDEGERYQDTVEINEHSRSYHYCNQNLVTQMKFPPLPEHIVEDAAAWMSESQELFAHTLTCTMLVSICVVGLTVLFWVTRQGMQWLCFFQRIQMERGFNVRFSDIHEAKGYVPQVNLKGHVFPLLLCDTRNIDKSLIGWTIEENNTYQDHTVIRDQPLAYDDSNCQDEICDMIYHDDESEFIQKRPMFALVKSWIEPSQIVIEDTTVGIEKLDETFLDDNTMENGMDEDASNVEDDSEDLGKNSLKNSESMFQEVKVLDWDSSSGAPSSGCDGDDENKEDVGTDDANDSSFKSNQSGDLEALSQCSLGDSICSAETDYVINLDDCEAREEEEQLDDAESKNISEKKRLLDDYKNMVQLGSRI